MLGWFLLACAGSPTPVEGVPPAAQAGGGWGADCSFEASCQAFGWCADYSVGGLPEDFDTACQLAGGIPADTPCEGEVVGGCYDGRVDGCGGVYVFDPLDEDPEGFCAALGATFAAVRVN